MPLLLQAKPATVLKESSFTTACPLFLYIMEWNSKEIIEKWRLFFRERKLPYDVTKTYMKYVSNIIMNKAVVIFDFEHLRMLLGVDADYLKSIIYAPEYHYREFKIKKRSGGERTISAPYYSLKQVQGWIYDNVLSEVPIHRCAHGFRPKRSIFSNVNLHLRGNDLLKVDLKDFFPSIKKNRVVQVFKKLGYAKDVAFYLASICCQNEELPQGAPTSPVISNIVAIHMDTRLHNLAKHFGFHYTRYADDIAFSGNSIPTRFIQYVISIIIECGFEVNNKKVRLYHQNDNKILTGIRIKDGQTKLPREKRRFIEQQIYYVLRYGVDAKSENGKTSIQHIQSVCGMAMFWQTVEPNNIRIKENVAQLTDLLHKLYEGR